MKKEFSKNFKPKDYEEQIYEKWESSGFFTPEIDSNKEPFTIMMPPPNITGQLHMGHALTYTLQDIIIRHKRMLGYSALWLPGTDHASIATEVKIVEALKAEGTSKEELGRDKFLERAYKWKEEYGTKIVEQLRRLGSSCDWSREAFTMDEKCSNAVIEAFVNLYNKGLIYRGDRIINWCIDCQTALSDAEVEYTEKDSHLWHINYPFQDGSGYITVATTRPETMLGDVAVAVNPKDARYKDKIGKLIELPLTDRVIPLIADSYVESDFGTGAVKITPAHDPNDFIVGQNHQLDSIKVISDEGIMNENAFEYKNLSREDARKKIVKDLETKGYINKIEEYNHNVGECYRCHTVIEPMVSKQWFVEMGALAEPAIEIVKSKEVNFIPDRFSKIYFSWLENIKDWCISRQLWWGHRIPAWYCADCEAVIVSKTTPSLCDQCGSKNIKQDEDVLDTWFSSALWPFSTLGFPEKTDDLNYFYPTNVLVTGYDIIFFWVARMIFSGIEHMNKYPFNEVLIHGIVRDALGRKMSKSLGNGIDPIDLIEKYGADVLRLSLCMGVAPGSDIRFSEEKMEPTRNFLNKLWNASRYILMNIDMDLESLDSVELKSPDKWILHRLNDITNQVNRNLNAYELGLAANKLYDFIWGDVCDWYIEITKVFLRSGEIAIKKASLSILVYVLKQSLKLLHPFAPYITEAIWEHVGDSDTIMLDSFPVYNEKLVYQKEYEDFEKIKDLIRAIRNIKAQMDVAPSKKINIYVLTESEELVDENANIIKTLAGCASISFIKDPKLLKEKTTSVITGSFQVFISVTELINVKDEIIRLELEIKKVNAEIQRGEKMLSNTGFVKKAPKELVELEENKLEENRHKLKNLDKRLKSLN